MLAGFGVAGAAVEAELEAGGLPKSEIAGEGIEIGRDAGATRPLRLMSTDATVVQASVLSERANRSVGSFRRRQLTQHVLEMDIRMWIEGLRNSLFSIPAAVFFF